MATLAILLPARAATGEGGSSAPRAARPSPLRVYAGAGFRLPIEAAAERFTAHTGIPVETMFAGSGCLLAQAELAGRGDVFIPGEEHYLSQARERGLAGESVRLAYLQPVIAVRRGNPLHVGALADLARPGLRVGLGDPKSVAVGLAAEAWIAAELAPETVRALCANARTRALNVNELGSQLVLGALDAAVVWDVTVKLFSDLEAVAPESGREHRTLISAAVLRTSDDPAAARAFVESLADSAGAALFRSFGYEPYAGAGPPRSGEAAPAAAALPPRSVARAAASPKGGDAPRR